jgi:hypothetical protein
LEPSDDRAPKSDAPKKNQKSQSYHVRPEHVRLSDYVSGSVLCIQVGLAGYIVGDFKRTALLFFLAGVVTALLGLFIHIRHGLFRKRLLALGPVALLVVLSLGLTCLGFLEITRQPNDAPFNVVALSSLQANAPASTAQFNRMNAISIFSAESGLCIRTGRVFDRIIALSGPILIEVKPVANGFVVGNAFPASNHHDCNGSIALIRTLIRLLSAFPTGKFLDAA